MDQVRLGLYAALLLPLKSFNCQLKYKQISLARIIMLNEEFIGSSDAEEWEITSQSIKMIGAGLWIIEKAKLWTVALLLGSLAESSMSDNLQDHQIKNAVDRYLAAEAVILNSGLENRSKNGRHRFKSMDDFEYTQTFAEATRLHQEFDFLQIFRDAEGNKPREIWTLHKRPEVASAVRAIHLEQFFRLPPWGMGYIRAHELMCSIQYDGKAMLTDSDGSKVEVLVTKGIVNEALQLQPRTYDLIPKTKAIDNEKVFLKVKGNKFKYSNLIYNELELPLRLISQHFRVQKPPRYIKPFLHMAVVMALCVAEGRQVQCDYAKFILENLIEANLKNSAKNKLYMSAGPMLTRIAYQALGMIKDLPAATSQAALIQQAKYVPKAMKTTNSTVSSRTMRSTRKSSSDDERTNTDKDQDSDESDHEDIPKGAEAKSPSEYERSDE
ncbi:hypothetical protein L7F22_056617 [Adiantum nelumboides]|nr:hypothetical protein [Adiantum nelumboides]